MSFMEEIYWSKKMIRCMKHIILFGAICSYMTVKECNSPIHNFEWFNITLGDQVFTKLESWIQLVAGFWMYMRIIDMAKFIHARNRELGFGYWIERLEATINTE